MAYNPLLIEAWASMLAEMRGNFHHAAQEPRHMQADIKLAVFTPTCRLSRVHGRDLLYTGKASRSWYVRGGKAEGRKHLGSYIFGGSWLDGGPPSPTPAANIEAWSPIDCIYSGDD
jgi:hypothetical protein